MVDGRRDESRTEAIARRLRGELGQLNMSVSEVARRTGLSQPALSRRMTGQLAFDVEELDFICETIEISFDYVVTGIRAVPELPPNPPVGASKSAGAGTNKRSLRTAKRRFNQPVGELTHLRSAA